MMEREIAEGLFRMSATIYANSGAEEISPKQIHKRIIEDALLQQTDGNIIALNDLLNTVKTKYYLTLTESEILLVLKDKKNEKCFNIQEDDEKLSVSQNPARRVFLQNQRQKDLKHYIDVFFQENDIENRNVDIFYRFFYGIFTSNFTAYKKLLQERCELSVEDETFCDEEKELINNFLNWNNSEKNKAIFNLASSALEYCMITNKKNAVLNLKNLKNKNLYLDTNILFRAIGINGEDRQKRALHFLKSFKSVDQNLYISKVTEDEFLYTIDYKLDELERLFKPAAHVNPRIYAETVQIDSIYKSYCNWKSNRINGSVELYKTELLARFRKVKEDYNIIKDSMMPFDKDEEVIKNKLTDYISNQRSYNPTKTNQGLENDAYNILWIENKRTGIDDDIFKVKDFFISSDQALRRWDYYRNSKEVPVVMMPSQWLSLTLRYLERTDDDYKSFVCFLNMKVNKSSLTEEQLVYVIEGISEATSDIQKQKFFIEEFVRRDYKKTIQNDNNDDLLVAAKNFAESEIEKESKEKDLVIGQKDEEIAKLNEEGAKKDAEIARLNKEGVLTEQQKKEFDELKAKEKELDSIKEEQRKQEEKELKCFKRNVIMATILIALFLSALLILFFVFETWEYNFVESIYKKLENFPDDKKNVAFGGITMVYLFMWVVDVKVFSMAWKLKKHSDKSNFWKRLFYWWEDKL